MLTKEIEGWALKKMIRVYQRGYIALLAFAVLVHSQQDHTGFISIDCGNDISYTDESTTIYYAPDSQYIETGINFDISPSYKVPTLQQQLQNVRSFPQGTKNCYTLTPAQGKGANYLVRAFFMYGNYDFLDNPPTFELHLGVDIWDTVKLDNSSQIVMKEMIHSPSTDFLYVCLANIGSGTPFISGLELRQLNDSIYKRDSGSLDLLYRYYTYTTSLDNIRYNDDIFDRIWAPMFLINGSQVSTKFDVTSSLNEFRLPSSVMKAAIVPANVSVPINFSHTPTTDESMEFYIYFHLAELSILRAGQVREFNISVNGLHLYGPYVPLYLTVNTIYNTKALIGSQLNVSIQSTERSTLPPILNAVEIFNIKKLSQISTNQLDVDAMRNIKLSYNLTKDWQGDPCVPKAYQWTGVNCSYETTSSPRIISLNLSSEELTGDIVTSISNLTALQVLNLSNNKLSGNVPEFLSELPSLRILNLAGNNFNGSVPEHLSERSRKGILSLSVESNPGLCSSTSCTPQMKNKTFISPIAACAALFVLLTAGVISFFVYSRRNKQKSSIVEAKKPQEPSYSQGKGGLARFTYSEVTHLTGGFQRELGKGGFGVVYYGCLKDGVEVAVKMLSPSINASEQYSTEVELLMSIRHKNLVSLVGYCEQGTHLALIYEYMARGNLETAISDAASECLSWKERLLIAIDAAQGLDYLHNGCRPSIVHRDVKTPNILLNKNLQAKIADFGLSKIFPDEDKSYVSTRVIGTTGYLDPEYHITQQLNEKSDVYSFGVVLLELITGKPAIMRKDDEQTSLVRWVSPLLEKGDVWSIVDKKLQEVHNPNSLWRVTDIALACVKLTAIERPTMSHIVTDLKECLEMELNRGNSTTGPDNNSIYMSPAISYTAMAPAAR